MLNPRLKKRPLHFVNDNKVPLQATVNDIDSNPCQYQAIPPDCPKHPHGQAAQSCDTNTLIHITKKNRSHQDSAYPNSKHYRTIDVNDII